MDTALVTGAAGFIGSHLVEELIQRGWTVRGLDDFSTGGRENLESVLETDEFSFREGDVSDQNKVKEMTDGVDAVFHQAAVASVPRSFEKPRLTTDVNCLGTATILECAQDAGVESIVLASSSAVYGSGGELPKREYSPVSSESPYALSKYYAEQVGLQISERSDMAITALRYFNVFGPRQDPSGPYAAVIPKFIELMAAGERPVIFGDGEQSRDFVYVSDVVEANILAAETEFTGVLNVARGKQTTINELVELVNNILAIELEPVYDDPRPGDIRHSVGDISKAVDRIGYEPDVEMKEGLKRTVDYFQ